MVKVTLRVLGVARTHCLNSSTSAERVSASVMLAPFGNIWSEASDLISN